MIIIIIHTSNAVKMLTGCCSNIRTVIIVLFPKRKTSGLMIIIYVFFCFAFNIYGPSQRDLPLQLLLHSYQGHTFQELLLRRPRIYTSDYLYSPNHSLNITKDKSLKHASVNSGKGKYYQTKDKQIVITWYKF